MGPGAWGPMGLRAHGPRARRARDGAAWSPKPLASGALGLRAGARPKRGAQVPQKVWYAAVTCAGAGSA